MPPKPAALEAGHGEVVPGLGARLTESARGESWMQECRLAWEAVGVEGASRGAGEVTGGGGRTGSGWAVMGPGGKENVAQPCWRGPGGRAVLPKPVKSGALTARAFRAGNGGA